MYRPTALAPASRMIALGEHLIAALRYTELAPELVPVVASAVSTVRHAANASEVALRAVVPARVAHRFAEAMLMDATRLLGREAATQKVVVEQRAGRAFSSVATELLALVAAHPNCASIHARHEASVRSAIEDLDAKSAAYDAALRQHEAVLRREDAPREQFVRVYADCIAKVQARIADPVLVEAFFDDPCARRSARTETPASEPASGEHLTTVGKRVAA